MSCEGGSAGPGIRKLRNVFWVGTYFMKLPQEIESKHSEVPLKSETYDLPLLNYKIRIEVSKREGCDIKVSCVRYPSDNSTIGEEYILRIDFTLIGIEETTKGADMLFNENRVSVSYSNDCFTKASSDEFISNNWQLKIVIRMIAYENLLKEPNANYEDTFRVWIPKVFESEGKKDSALLRERETFISRKEAYASDLLDYLKARKRHDATLPKPNFSYILNWILSEENGPIQKNDIIVALSKSYRLGLNFLRIITTAYILEILKEDLDLDFVVDIIKTADLVDDPILLDGVSSIFMKKSEAIMNSDKWKQVLEETNSKAHSIKHKLRIRQKSRGKSTSIDPKKYEEINLFQRLDASYVLKLYREKMHSDKSDVILDIGCGIGDVTKDILAPALESFELLLGVDRSLDMVNYSNNHNSSNNIHYKELDIASDVDVIYFEADWGPFSKIYSFYCLHWIKDLKKALSNISYLLRKDGQCLLVFVAACPVFTMYKRMASFPEWEEYMLDVNEFVPDTHNSDDSIDLVSRMMEEVGIKVIDCELVPKTYEFTKDQLKLAVTALNPFKERVPYPERTGYIDACLETLSDINEELGVKKDILRFSYTLLVAHGSAK